MSGAVHRIVLVEDNPGDVRLLHESLRMQGVSYELIHFETLDDAVRAFATYGQQGHQVPDLILLDYNVPRGDARDMLAAAAKNPALNSVPKAVVTSSVAPRDREQALQLGAICFINKPPDLDEFLTEVGSKVAALLKQES